MRTTEILRVDDNPADTDLTSEVWIGATLSQPFNVEWTSA
jgi:hypothetical protein